MKQYERPQVTALNESVFGIRAGKSAGSCHTSCGSSMPM